MSHWEAGNRIYTNSFSVLRIDLKRWTTRQLTHRWSTYRSACSCPMTILSFNGECPSFINHPVLLTGNDLPGSLCEYDSLHEPFRHLNSSLLVLRNIVIAAGLWLKYILVSTGLGKLESLYNVRLAWYVDGRLLAFKQWWCYHPDCMS